ncbi:MAG: RDD family protein [Cyclobacteriaceae bacterium]|jgi:uncharacterized RDD family membrane protein YckC|nr:RDD family protein [Cyclobacteriaceae bacterium]
MSSTNYAGFWLRFVAYLIDAVIIYCVQAILIVPVLGLLGITFGQDISAFESMSEEEALTMFASVVAAASATSAVFLVLTMLYFSLMESSQYQATVGKIVLGLKVTDEQGQKPDFVKALLRNLCKILSSLIFMVGYIMAGFTEKKQGLHDIIAKTLVVKK